MKSLILEAHDQMIREVHEEQMANALLELGIPKETIKKARDIANNK